MPDDASPGPSGPSCPVQIRQEISSIAAESAAISQGGAITRVVELHGDDHPIGSSVHHAGASLPTTLTDPRGGLGATTGAPHLHERWQESRKLELSYCINGMPGDDAEKVASYEKVVSVLNATTAEWERVTGANFIHLVGDDMPYDPPAAIVGDAGGIVLLADCSPGTTAFLGVFAVEQSPIQGLTNTLPQTWSDPSLDPVDGALARAITLDRDIVLAPGTTTPYTVIRHELGHIMGFLHEEINLPGQSGNGCTDQDPRPLTPVDAASVLSTPGCPDLQDAGVLSHRDRLSAFFLNHTPRSRFETSSMTAGYRFRGASGRAEILWHGDGGAEGVLWQAQDDGSFVEIPLTYHPAAGSPSVPWFPNDSEVVIPLHLDSDPWHDLLFYGPGPSVDDFVVLNDGVDSTVYSWTDDSFSVPVVGAFNSSDTSRDAVYLYRPGTMESVVLTITGGVVASLTEVPQQPGFAFPIAAPFRGPGFPDDLVWLDPVAATITTWRLGDGVLTLAESATVPQEDLDLAPGENIPVVGDFDGDDRADIMWHGVSNLPAGLHDIEDVLWLSQSTATALAFATISKAVGNSYRPFVGDFDGNGVDDIFWHRSWGMTSKGPSTTTTGPSFVWYFDGTGAHTSKAFTPSGDHSPYVGDFDGDGCHDIAWFDAPADMLSVWSCLPQEQDFDCGPALPTPAGMAPVGIHWAF